MLPFGTFEVLDHPRPPLRGWFLDRVRVTYRKKRTSGSRCGSELERGAGRGGKGPDYVTGTVT